MSRLFLALSILTLVSACGVQGDLERPNPLWGGQHAIDVECRRERAHKETLDHRCTPAAPASAAAAAPPAATAPVTPPTSPTSPDTTTTTTSTTTPSSTP